MRYKPHLDWSIKVGLIEMIQEKWQPKAGKGRARTWVIYVPRSPIQERTLRYAEAIEYATQRLLSTNNDSKEANQEGE